jgi:hypothetical protein
VLLGGTSPRVFKRAADYGDGWIPWMIAPERLSAGRDQLLREFDAADRDPGKAQVTVFASRADKSLADQYVAAGADRVVFTVNTAPEAKPKERIEVIARLIGL